MEAVAECVGDHSLGVPMNREQNVRDHPLGSPVGRELCGCNCQKNLRKELSSQNSPGQEANQNPGLSNRRIKLPTKWVRVPAGENRQGTGCLLPRNFPMSQCRRHSGGPWLCRYFGHKVVVKGSMCRRFLVPWDAQCPEHCHILTQISHGLPLSLNPLSLAVSP